MSSSVFSLSISQSVCRSVKVQGVSLPKLVVYLKIFQVLEKYLGLNSTFCGKELIKNGSRMKYHVKICTICPKSVKEKYVKNNSNTTDSDGSISSEISMDRNSDAESSTSSMTNKKQILSFIDNMQPADQN